MSKSSSLRVPAPCGRERVPGHSFPGPRNRVSLCEVVRAACCVRLGDVARKMKLQVTIAPISLSHRIPFQDFMLQFGSIESMNASIRRREDRGVGAAENCKVYSSCRAQLVAHAMNRGRDVARALPNFYPLQLTRVKTHDANLPPAASTNLLSIVKAASAPPHVIRNHHPTPRQRRTRQRKLPPPK